MAEKLTMPISPKLLGKEAVTIINNRIADEFIAHYFYMNAANWCNGVGFQNAAKFFQAESDNELAHAKGLQDYLVGWNVDPVIPQVKTEYEITSLVGIINEAYNLEYDLLQKYMQGSELLMGKDLATFDFLQGYRQIQNDSVKEYADLLNVLEMLNLGEGDYNYKVIYFENNYLNG